MGWILLLAWWFIIAVTIGGLLLLAAAIASGVLIAVGVLFSSAYWSLKEWKLQKHVPAWAEFLDDI